jgi:hypothetical protein
MTATATAVHGITVERVPSQDQPHAGLDSKASCLCGWSSHVMPRIDVIVAGHRHVDRAPTPSTGPVECQPWCVYADGHSNATFREDQWCGTEMLKVDLTLPQVGDDEPYALVSAYQAPGETLMVLVGHGDGPEMRFTPDEARQLVENVQLVLGQVKV